MVVWLEKELGEAWILGKRVGKYGYGAVAGIVGIMTNTLRTYNYNLFIRDIWVIQ